LVLERPEGVRSWLTTTIIGGQAIILLVIILFLTLNRQTTRTADYIQTASAPPSSLSREQPTSTQLESLIPSITSLSANSTTIAAEPQEGEKMPLAQSSPVNEPEEIEEIKSLLEKIRQANLQKNIDLFMSCYSTDFKERESKRKATLETWDNYNYLDLSYTLEDYSKSGLTAQAKVEWLIKFYLKEGSKTKENKTALNVRFKKEDGSWKIKETKPVG